MKLPKLSRSRSTEKYLVALDNTKRVKCLGLFGGRTTEAPTKREKPSTEGKKSGDSVVVNVPTTETEDRFWEDTSQVPLLQEGEITENNTEDNVSDTLKDIGGGVKPNVDAGPCSKEGHAQKSLKDQEVDEDDAEEQKRQELMAILYAKMRQFAELQQETANLKHSIDNEKKRILQRQQRQQQLAHQNGRRRHPKDQVSFLAVSVSNKAGQSCFNTNIQERRGGTNSSTKAPKSSSSRAKRNKQKLINE
jgi:hypothetical protein